MKIRTLEKSDMKRLADLYRQFWNEQSDVEKMEAQFDAIQRENSHLLLGAEQDGLLIGSVMGVICKELYGDCRPFLVIENMIVDDLGRRKGVGSALLSELEKRARERQCTQMILVTEIERQDACGFYESVGVLMINKGYKIEFVPEGYKKKL